VAPIYEGKFMGIIAAEEAERESIGAMMAGWSGGQVVLGQVVECQGTPSDHLTI
jgi:hypothetical protein